MMRSVLLCAAILAATAVPAAAQKDLPVRLVLGDRPQTVHIYKTPGPPQAVVLLSSGDLGWMGFVVDVAEFLQAHNVAVLGLNTRAYLSSFTGKGRALDPADIPGHYESLSREARRIFAVSDAPVLVGISEGAGLSVVAAAGENRETLYRGVIGLGLPASIELGWNAWKDWTIWITKGEPNEPHLTITPHVSRVSPLPMIFIQSKRDEFIPPQETDELFIAAREPKRMYAIDAKNHRFSDKQPELRSSLLDALQWIDSTSR